MYDVIIQEYLDDQIEWSSSDPAVADVVDGTVVARNPGQTFITAKLKNNPGFSDVCLLKVITRDTNNGGSLQEVPLSEFSGYTIQPFIRIYSENDISHNTTVKDCISELEGKIELIGSPIDIVTLSEFDWAEVGFRINDTSIDVAKLNDMVICWYDEENNVIVPQATCINYEDKTVHATVPHFSKYFLTYKKSINAKQINIVCVIDNIYSSQQKIDNAVVIINNMVRTLVSKDEYNFNVFFLDTRNRTTFNPIQNNIPVEWQKVYTGLLTSSNETITPDNKEIAEGIVTEAMQTAHNYLTNSGDSILKLGKNGRVHNYVIGFLDGFWYVEDTVNHTNEMKKSIVKFANATTHLLVCENGLKFNGKTIVSSDTDEMKQILPDLLLSIFNVENKVTIPVRAKIYINDNALRLYQRIVLTKTSSAMDDEVVRQVTGYGGKIISGKFSDGKGFLAAEEDIVISLSNFDINKKLNSEGIIHWDNLEIGLDDEVLLALVNHIIKLYFAKVTSYCTIPIISATIFAIASKRGV